jgi:hypothetical protein
MPGPGVAADECASAKAAIAHKDPSYPKIGAGLVRAPAECFKKALIAFGKRYGA